MPRRLDARQRDAPAPAPGSHTTAAPHRLDSAWPGGLDAAGEHVFGDEARVDAEQTLKTREQEPRANQQHERQRRPVRRPASAARSRRSGRPCPNVPLRGARCSDSRAPAAAPAPRRRRCRAAERARASWPAPPPSRRISCARGRSVKPIHSIASRLAYPSATPSDAPTIVRSVASVMSCFAMRGGSARRWRCAWQAPSCARCAHEGEVGDVHGGDQHDEERRRPRASAAPRGRCARCRPRAAELGAYSRRCTSSVLERPGPLDDRRVLRVDLRLGPRERDARARAAQAARGSGCGAGPRPAPPA